MKKINFKKIEFYNSFEDEEKGKVSTIDIAQYFGNLMKYDGGIIMDIAFEDLAKDIYYKGEVEVEDRFIEPMATLVKGSILKASIKRSILKQLGL